jgi:D-amino-acid dehydrogenase
MPVKDESLAQEVSLADDEFKLVFSRLGERLHIAGTAECPFGGGDGLPGSWHGSLVEPAQRTVARIGATDGKC